MYDSFAAMGKINQEQFNIWVPAVVGGLVVSIVAACVWKHLEGVLKVCCCARICERPSYHTSSAISTPPDNQLTTIRPSQEIVSTSHGNTGKYIEKKETRIEIVHTDYKTTKVKVEAKGRIDSNTTFSAKSEETYTTWCK